MHPRLTRSLLGILVVALIVGCVQRARADETIEASLGDQKATVDKEDKLHLEATADINAPVDKVYDAMTHPEKVAKYDAQIDAVKVISDGAAGKVVEFKGQTLPIPNAPPALQVKYTFDPAKKSLTAESYGKSPIQFRSDYALKPSKDGKGTEISYTSVSSSVAKLMGTDTPQFMRQTLALDNFMRQLHSVSQYLMKGGK
jgi:carbon monoxide dehydrogenase subunit G